MTRRGARVAVVGALGTIAVVLVGVTQVRREVVERWHIHEIEAGFRTYLGEEGVSDWPPCQEHLAALVEMKSLRAIRELSRVTAVLSYGSDCDPDAVLNALVEAAWPESVEALVEMLDSPDADTRAWSVHRLTDEDRELPLERRLAALAAALRNADGEVRVVAAHSINAFGALAGPAASALEDAVRDPRVAVRLFALSALSRIEGRDRGVEAAAAAALADPSYEVRQDAASFLDELEVAPARRRDLVLQALRDPDEDVRIAAMHCLSPRWDVEHDVERERLFRLLEDRSMQVRIEVVHYLSWPSFSPEHSPRAFQELKKLSPRARERLAFLFVQHPTAFTPLCLEALRDPASDIRTWAAAMLFQIGPRGTAELPVLIEVLRDEHGEARMWAVENLGTRKGGAAISGLVEALKDPLRQIRARAAHLLGGLDLVASEVTPALDAALQDPDPATRVSAAATLLKVAPENEAALAVLRRGLKDEGFVIRCYTLREIRRAGPSAQRLRSDVAPLIEDPADEVCHLAREALDRDDRM